MGVRHNLLAFSHFKLQNFANMTANRPYRFCDKVKTNCASDGFVTASLTVHQLVNYIQYSGNIWHVISLIALILAFSELHILQIA